MIDSLDFTLIHTKFYHLYFVKFVLLLSVYIFVHLEDFPKIQPLFKFCYRCLAGFEVSLKKVETCSKLTVKDFVISLNLFHTNFFFYLNAFGLQPSPQDTENHYNYNICVIPVN